MDMGTIIVEGKVFAVDHKELTKRNAFVVKFDMTDNTGSIRVSRFLEAKEAAPIIENVKIGSVLRVQGKLIEDRFENDMVLKPYAMMPGAMPKRKDLAEGEKRVELHLHTTMSNMDALTDTAAAVKQAAAWGHPRRRPVLPRCHEGGKQGQGGGHRGEYQDPLRLRRILCK